MSGALSSFVSRGRQFRLQFCWVICGGGCMARWGGGRVLSNIQCYFESNPFHSVLLSKDPPPQGYPINATPPACIRDRLTLKLTDLLPYQTALARN